MTSATLTSNKERADRAHSNLNDVVVRLRTSGEFKDVHPARWRHLASGHHVETGYSYGEGILRVFLGGGRRADHRFVLSGREDDLDAFNTLFPVSST